MVLRFSEISRVEPQLLKTKHLPNTEKSIGLMKTLNSKHLTLHPKTQNFPSTLKSFLCSTVHSQNEILGFCP